MKGEAGKPSSSDWMEGARASNLRSSIFPFFFFVFLSFFRFFSFSLSLLVGRPRLRRLTFAPTAGGEGAKTTRGETKGERLDSRWSRRCDMGERKKRKRE